MKRLLIASLLLAALPARAFTPESGWWWNPDESGRGFNIEIQDNVAVISTYVFEPSGDPIWFLGTGRVLGYGGSDPSPFVQTQLDGYENGQCITCDYDDPPDPIPRQGGAFRIDFTSRTTGIITWSDDSTTPIQRFEYAWSDETEKMLGEWQMVVDFSSETEDGFAFWSGDALVFDEILSDEMGPYYAGARKYSRAFETGDAGDLGDAAGQYDDPSGDAPGSPGIHTIVVENSSKPEEKWLAYYVTVGTNGIDGIAEVYCDTEVLGDDCGPTGQGVPARGWRSASRKFVQDGSGPAKAGQAHPPPGGATGIPTPESWSPLREHPGGKSLEELTNNPALAERAREAARRLTERLRAGR